MTKLKPNEYECDNCHTVYGKEWSDEEARTEYEANFPNASAANMPEAIVCDDCYQQMVAWRDPKQYDSEHNDKQKNKS